MRKKCFIKTIGIQIALVLFFVIPVSAQNYVVNSNLDAAAANLVTGETATPGQITLRSAVQAATAQPGTHIITFSGAVVSPINLTLGQISVGSATNSSTDIRINGPGMAVLTINQTTANRIFITPGGAPGAGISFLLQDITLNYTGPATSYGGGGGAILTGAANAATTLVNVTISNFNQQVGNGGAISASSSLNSHSLTLTNCVFINNRCGGAGGAVSYNGLSTATITGCTFNNNHTGVVGANTGGDGGALNLSGGGSGGTYLVERNTFLNNQAENPGSHAGAIMSTNGTATIRFNRFIGNTCLNVANPPFANVIGQAGGATTHVTIADNNWWGVNTGPGTNDATALNAGAVMTLTKWLQKKTTASPNPICNTPAGLGNTTTVTASYLSNSANEAIAVGNLTSIIGLPVTWGPTTLGSLSGQQGTIQANGTATATFTSNGTGGIATVNTQLDNVPAGETSPARANITVNTIPTVTAPANFTSCVGGTATFTSTITGTPAPTIVWRIGSTALVNGPQGSGSTVSGQGTATLTITNVQPSDAAATYNVQASNQCGLATSGNATLTVNQVTGGTVAADQTICSGGDPAAFTESAASTGSGVLTYQWQSSTTSCAAGFSNIGGATSATYDAPSGLTVTTYYRRVTTSTLNAVPCTANSNCITVTVNNVTGGTVAADQTICSGGDPAAFTQTVASTGSGVLTYQWQSSTTSCAAGFSNIGGATSATYDAPSGLTVTTYYRRVTTSTLNAVPCTANSNCITVTVNGVTGGTVGSDQTICSGGDPAAFTESVASTGSGVLTYQWQSSTTSCAAGFSNIGGATSATYDAPSGLTVTTYYRRVTTSTLNAVPCTANSNCITVTVNDVTGGTVGSDQTICSSDDPAAFTETVASTGSGTLTYQWQSSTTSCVAGFTDIGGATGTTYDAPSGLTVTTYYRRVTTSTLNAVPCTAFSNCITITVNTLPTTANAGPDRNLCLPSTNLNMAGNAPTAGAGTWTQISGPVTAAITNPNNPTTSVGGLNTAGVYTFVWTISNVPCPSTTDTMTITVSAAPPFFDVIGANACQGTTVTLAGAVDPNYTYAWRRSLSGLSGSFTSIGGNTQTLPVTVSGNYQLTTTNQFGCTMVDTAIVHIGDYFFNGTLAAGDAQLTNRINRFGQVSTCAAPKACPGVFSGPGARLYDSYQIVNKRNVPVCATIGLASSCGVNIFNVAYLRSFDPANPCTNYLGDPGSSFPASGFMEVTIPALDTILIVVHEVNGGTGCAGYFLSVDVPRDPAGITVNPTPPICSGGPVTLTGAVAETYSWTPGGATTQAINVTPTATTQYNVTYGYGNHGCIRLDSANIIVGNTVTTAFAGNDTATCGTVITLAANTPVTGTGAWSQVSGPGTVTFGAANSPTSTATASANGSYTLRWTITAGAPCPGTSQDDIIVNFDATPTANAGPDLTVCAVPGSRTLSAVAPVAGSGSWSFVSGPATASIFPPPTNPNAGVVGMTVPGTYTFEWVVTNGSCPVSRDTMVVVANPSPPTPTITGGGVIVCAGSTVTMSGPADPNYTYNWERALGSNGAAFSSVGTSQTLNTTVSGVFRLTVTNQFGCSATSAQTIVHIADYVFNGSIGAGDLQQTGRINRFAQISTCAVPKACPGLFATTGARFYDPYTITNNRSVPVCATIGMNVPCSTNVFMVAYLNSFDPSNTCTNYLGDPGSSFTLGGFMEVTIPANTSIVVVVHEVNTGQGCGSYTLTVDVPRDLSAIVVNPPTVTCASTATLTAPVAGSYLWSPGGATTQSITTPPLFTNTQYNVTLGYGNNGCTREDSTTVVVTSAPPTVTCPSNITLSNTTGQCGRTVTYTTTVGGTPTPTLTYSFAGATTGSGAGNGSGSFFNVGTTTVTVTATNSCGSVNCSFTVTINDTEPPTVTTGTIASCYPTAAAAEAAALAATSATDNCPGVLTETASTVGTCSAVVTVRTTDVAGNFTDVTYNTRIDNTAPTVTVGTIASCYPTVAAAEAAALAATSATDNCPGALTEVASTVGTCSAVITVTTTDACGNATAVTYNTRIDNTAPTVTVGTIASCYPTVAAAEAAALAATSATDNCPGALTEIASTVGTCSAVITVTTTDACGNATSVTYNTRIDGAAPTVTCPAPVTVSCAANVPAPNTALVTATDNCPGALTTIHVGDVISAQTCANRYTVTRTYRVTDGCGNFTDCTQIITVNDQTPPTITCPAPITVSCAAAVPAPNTALVTATDNCAGAITITHISDVISNQTCANRYTVTRTYRATDVCGNFSQCTQIITVNDQTPPVVTCPAPVTVSCASAVPAPNTALVTATDNCAGAITITHIGDVISNQTCPNRFTVTRTYRATDVCGNFAECTQIITVNDQTAPVITCPANISVTTPVGSCTAVVNFIVGATDNCAGPVTIVSSPASGFAFPIGTTTVTSTATDACGNSSTCTFTVTVADAQLPTITAQPQNRTVCAGQNATFSVTAITAPSANGPLAYQWQQWNGTAWVDVAGATASSYTINGVTQVMNTNTFRVRITGLCTIIFSNPATLTVNPLPSITLNASPLAALLPPQITTITATVNPTGGSFVWSLNGGIIPGATGNTLGPITVNGIGTYQAVYTDPNGCVSTSAALNITAMASSNLWVYPVPNTGTFNVRFYNQTGEAATLKVYNAVGQVIYQQALSLGITYSNTVVNLGNVPAGVYVVKVVNSSNLELAAKRIVVYHP